MDYVLCLKPGNRITIEDSYGPISIVSDIEILPALECLRRYRILANCGDVNNVHKTYLLGAFPRRNGRIYVMAPDDAKVLAKTGRSMEDVRVYIYRDEHIAKLVCI